MALAASIRAMTLAFAFLNFVPLPSEITLRGPRSISRPCNVSTAFLIAASASDPAKTTRPKPSPVPVTGCLSIIMSRMSPHPANRISKSRVVVLKARCEIKTPCWVIELLSRYMVFGVQALVNVYLQRTDAKSNSCACGFQPCKCTSNLPQTAQGSACP